jgi:hypothetical protein
MRVISSVFLHHDRIHCSLPQRAFTDEQERELALLFNDNQDWADAIDEDSRIDAQDLLTAVELYESIMIVDQE